MNVALQALLARYEPHTLADYENALKEVIQELAFLGRGIPCDVGAPAGSHGTDRSLARG